MSSRYVAVGVVCALLGLLVAGGAACRSETPGSPEVAKPGAPETAEVAKTEPPAGDEESGEASKKAEPAATPKRPVVFLGAGGELFAVVPGDGAVPRSLGVRAEDNGGGNVDTGSSTPLLSWDGQWVGLVRGEDLYVVKVADGKETRITNFYPKAPDLANIVNVLISGWSPDSQTLLFHQTQPTFEEDDPAPLPAGESYGFHTVAVSSMAKTVGPAYPGFTAWASDGKGVLHNLYRNKDDYALMRYPADGSAGAAVRTSTDGYGFSQITVQGSAATWLEGKRVVCATLPDGPTTPVTPVGAFADHQWPKLSPDGKQIAFQWGPAGGSRSLALAVDADTPHRVLEPCSGSCNFYWYDADRLAVSSTEGVRLVTVDGKRTDLAPSGELVPLGIR